MPISPVSQSNWLTKQEVTDKLSEHIKGKSYSHLTQVQQDVLQQRMRTVEKWGRFNFYGDPREDIDGFLKSIDEMITSIGSPIETPDLPALGPMVSKMYGLFFKTIPTFNEIWSEKKLFRHLFLEQNPKLMSEGRDLLKTLLKEIFAQLQSADIPINIASAEGLVGNILALYPFLDPQNAEKIEVPIYDNNRWTMGEYTIESVQLTPSWMGSPVISYGLIPSGNLPPLMLFKGTSYPSDNGFFLQLLTDFNPFGSVGSYLFNICKGNIEKWLDNSAKTAKRNARLYGVSLGGALTEHTVVEYPYLIEKVYAFNAPALLGFELTNWTKSWKKSKGVGMPEVNVYCQDNDLVSNLGIKWGKGWNVYKVFGPLKSQSMLLGHLRCFLADKESMMLKMDRGLESNQKVRWVLTILHQLVSIPFFMLGSLVWLVHIGLQHLEPFLLNFFNDNDDQKSS